VQKQKYNLLLALVILSAAFFCPVLASGKTKWQGLLERNNVPKSFWQQYLPNVSRGEYHDTIQAYLAGNTSVQNVGNTAVQNNQNNSGNDNGPKIIKGKYPLPEDSGQIAIEQHLWLKDNQSAKDHYQMTNTPKSSQNGMAGGYGAFGPLDKSDKKAETYYVTMRWGYADWVEPASGLTSALGKNDASLTLKSASDFSHSGYVKIGKEYIHFSSKSGNKLKGLSRGYKSSTASHSKGDRVKQVYRYSGSQWERQTRVLSISGTKKSWYREKRVLVTNKRNDKQVVTAVLESGPAIWTGRAGGLSPEAFAAISAKNDENCTFQFVDDNTPLGPVD